ncbi:MAG TPA: WGR domain-containing protein [Gemmataceae bacterium]
MRTFTFSDVKSHKFWNIELQGDSFTVTYGRQGTAGQTQTKKFASAAAAQKEHDKLIKEKLAKGYVETTPTAKPKASLREALEDALVANPADLAAHMAYADYLQEQGNPRGEYIQVQLALEDPSRSPAERKELQKREAKLFKQHGREWLGELAPYLIDKQQEAKRREWDPDAGYVFQFRRGWLDSLELTNYRLAFTRILARAPQMRLLRRLVLNEGSFEEPGEYEPGDDVPADAYSPALFALLRSPYLGNIRVLQFGEQADDDQDYFNCHMSGEVLIGLVKLMPRLEELYVLSQDVDTDQLFSLKTLNNLRILQVYHMDNYPLQKLAKNPSLNNLTHLLIHPHCMREDEPYLRLPQVRAVVRSTALKSLTHLRLRQCDMGDQGVEEIVASGILKRLKLLDLRNGRITDTGARLLAGCPDLRNLELLNLNRNCLTADGIAALKATRVKFTSDGQWQPTGDEYSDQEYLYEGDTE